MAPHKKGSFKYSMIILLAAFIWGTSFVGQRWGMSSMTPIYFNSIRLFMAALFLLPVYLYTERKRMHGLARNHIAPTEEEKHNRRKNLVIGGLTCSIAIFMASNLQQLGMVTISAGKSGFLTAMYIVMVPIAGIFLNHKTTIMSWISVALAVVGLYFLCITESFGLAIGDLYTLLCAMFFTIHILVMNHFAPKTSVVGIVCIQALVSAIIGIIIAFFTEEITWSGFVTALPALLYVGVLSGGVAYTLQGIGQKGAHPTVAAVLMSMESLFAVISGFIILGERFTGRELLGCALMLAAIIITQLPTPRTHKKAEIPKDRIE